MSKLKLPGIAVVLGGILSSATRTDVTPYQATPGAVYAAVGQEAVHQPHDHVGLHRLPERGRRPTTEVISAGSASPVMVPPWSPWRTDWTPARGCLSNEA